MSKDIRSYFLKSKSSSKETDSPKSKKRNHRVIESDDEKDDELILSKKKAKESQTTSKLKPEKKKPEIIVDTESFFGSKPVVQKKQTIIHKIPEKEKPLSKKQKKTDKKKNSDKSVPEPCFQNDDELEASLLKTDDEELLLLENQKAYDRSENKVVPSRGQETKKSPRKVVENKITPKKGEKTPKKDDDKRKTPKAEQLKQKTPKQDQGLADNSFINSEQKRRNAEAYQKFLNRSGPKNPGSKTIPKGTPSCLQGLTFVITGVLDSLEREEAIELIQKCGGRVTGSVSKKTDYVVVGEEPGVSKIQKADGFGTKKINEDELLNLISNRSGGACESKERDFVEGTPEKITARFHKITPKKKLEEASSSPKKARIEEKTKNTETNMSATLNNAAEVGETDFKAVDKTAGDMLWVDKYKPKSTKNIVGQAGDKSNVKKLTKWLENWHKNHSNKEGKKPTRPAPWAQNDDGSYYKAALLSGPPGVGKTTTVHLVCKELGFDVVEFNASDTRSKRLLQEEVSELLSTKSVRGFFQGEGNVFKRHVLVMDEVDGMAGNEDRGGVQELIQLIKNTKIPVVGMCNDRNHPKMRSLVNYCFDLRFHRPRIEQIKAAMKSVCFKEKLEISGEALEELIVSSNHDIRQVLHNLSLLSSGHNSLSLEEAKKKGQQAKKPLNLSPWDVVRKVFSESERGKMTFTDKTDLFFQDYSLGPLFVQDTYLRVKPYKAKNDKQKLELISETANSLALGDIVEKMIRSQNAWSLLPVQAVFSSVLPGYHMSGHVQGQVQFPVWLGKNSRSNKFDRLLQDLNSSLKINTSGSKESVNLDYLGHLKNSIVKPLVDEGLQGVRNALQFMLEYHLTREDLDSILELSSWPGVKEPFSEVDSKVKAALTRVLNKEGHMVASIRKGTRVKGDSEDIEEEDVSEELEEDSENIESDPMIKVKKPKLKKDAEEKDKKDKKDEKKKAPPKKETKKGKK